MHYLSLEGRLTQYYCLENFRQAEAGVKYSISIILAEMGQPSPGHRRKKAQS